MSVVQYAILNDIHFPYEGKAYYKALDQMREWPDLRGIYLNGDISEIESVSSHARRPDSLTKLQYEIDYLNQKLDTLQTMFKGVMLYYICGNHEYRIFRYIRDIAPQLWGMVDCPKLMRADERTDFKYIDYSVNQLVKIGETRDLYCRHEPLAGGANHSKGTAEKSVVSIVYGHTHVHQSYTHKKFGPTPYNVTALSNGFLGDINKPCFEYRGPKDNWQNGFSKVECNTVNGEYELRFLHL